MRLPTSKTLLARTGPHRFVGREEELERLYLRSIASSGRGALLVTAPAGAGLSELLRQLYDRAFFEQRFVVPFYFSLRAEDKTARAAAARYQYEFLLQAVAFRRQRPGLIASAPDICELAKLAPLQDAEWVNRMCEVCRNDGPLNDERAFIRAALNAPFRAAAAAGLQVVVAVDDLHEIANIENGAVISTELVSIAERANVPLVLGSRGGSFEPSTALERIDIDRLDRREMADLVQLSAAEFDITTGDSTRDLIAAKFEGKPGLVEMFIQAARSKKASLESYKDVERLYSEELLNGRLGFHFDQIFSGASPDAAIRQQLYNELFLTLGETNASFSASVLRERLGLRSDEFGSLVERLRSDEILLVDGASIRLASDEVLKDFLAARNRASAERRTPAAIAAFTVTNSLKRAPKTMARIYRREASVGLAGLLLLFDVQDVPRALIDFAAFREDLKGLTDAETRERLVAAENKVTLPQIVHAAAINEHLPELFAAEPERAVVGIGFADQDYREEIVWLAAEVDSKLEADAALAQDWCDKLDLAARELGYEEHRIWLVAPEGFSDAALEILAERNGFGSSRRQVELLKRHLLGNDVVAGPATAEYEMVIPIGDETELIAAHALEEIARRYDLPAKTVNQIKTALVEACINVAEHSLTPDGRIHQKFQVSTEKITITVSNRGLRLADRRAEETSGDDEGRRGWGLGLIRNLMDEVHVVPVDDGTRIVMTKFFAAASKI
jgi:serine/threonine-protein kinase RsbW